MACTICCEEFNKVARSKVVCTHCNIETCKSCVSRYLLSSTQDAHCMSCKARWTRDFMFYNLNSTFLNITYAKHRGGVLYEMEKALLAETIPVAILRKQIDDTLLKLDPLKRENEELRDAYHLISFDLLHRPSKEQELKTIRDRRLTLQREILKVNSERRRLEREIEDLDATTMRSASTQRTTTKQAQKYIRPCAGEECRGFISTNMVCSLCETEYCEKCHEVLTSRHSCKAEDIESATAIMKDSKNCPNCHVVTYKISGCSQMWCTLCHTVWNWNTGAVETGIVHNPHYFEYMRKTGSLPGANQGIQARCFGGENAGERFRIIDISDTIQRLKFPIYPDFIYTIYRLRNHITAVEMPRYATHQLWENRDLRIRYLLNSIDEKRFKQLLHQREKRSAKKREFEQVMQMVSNVLMDLMAKFVRSSTPEEAMCVQSEFHNLCEYANESMQHIGKIFKCKHPEIDQHFNIIS